MALVRHGRRVLEDVTFDLEPGSLTVLVGPNGAGKSTLLAALAGDLKPAAGTLVHHGLARPSPRAWARVRALLPQRPSVAFAFTVHEVVAMGLHPHGLAGDRAPGDRLVADALAACDLGPLAHRPVTTLSGGEAQRVHLARVLVQAEGARQAGLAPLLLLDEPTTGLDLRHQVALAQELRHRARQGITLVASLHDLALARRLADRVMLLAEGRVRAWGPASEALAPPLIARWFGLDPAEARHLAA
ncbi:ABC transporter ATP-binding protein [Thermaurantiacus sp.]|uniref:ABC transporter ATP-binding protein n=1 Tax=Thermaurantiacus sp. TaxID=2820283 RepID=UPI00298ED32B|nr:ATP-binding cassette domain-containing protein [Thermaurantiacus sp.]